MKKFKLLTMLTILLLIISACGTTDSSNTKQENEKITLVVGHTGTKGNSVYMFFHQLKEEIEKRSNGQIILEVHDGGSLGGDNQLIEGLKLGSIDMASSAGSNMTAFSKDLNVLDLPYIFTSRDSAHKVLHGEIGENLLNKLGSSAGTHALAFIDVGGFRLLTNTKKEVKTPKDLKGLKLRTTTSHIEVELTKVLGANPTPVAWGETYTALEQKMVDGLQLQPIWVKLNGFGEVIKYATHIKALMAFHVVQFNEKKWDSLSAEQQKLIEESVVAARDAANKEDRDGEGKFISELEADGVEIYEPTDEELKQWKIQGIKSWKTFSNEINSELINKIIDYQK